MTIAGSTENRGSSTADLVSVVVLLAAVLVGIAVSVVYAFDLGPPWLFPLLGWSMVALAIAVAVVFVIEARRTGKSWFRAFGRGAREAIDFLFTWLP